LKKDKLKVNGVTYDIDYLRRDVQLESRSNAVDNPADKSLEVAEEITQQLTGNAIRESTEGRASNTEMDVWSNEGARATSSAGYYVTAKTAADAGTEN
jgi:ectoine hydroxylase-related dioxygenase (phytanoyl-CoA dioxygenase family)